MVLQRAMLLGTVAGGAKQKACKQALPSASAGPAWFSRGLSTWRRPLPQPGVLVVCGDGAAERAVLQCSSGAGAAQHSPCGVGGGAVER